MSKGRWKTRRDPALIARDHRERERRRYWAKKSERAAARTAAFVAAGFKIGRFPTDWPGRQH